MGDPEHPCSCAFAVFSQPAQESYYYSLFRPWRVGTVQQVPLGPNDWILPMLLSCGLFHQQVHFQRRSRSIFQCLFPRSQPPLLGTTVDHENRIIRSFVFFFSFASSITDEHILNTFLSCPRCFRNNLRQSQGLHLVRPPPSTPPPQRLELLELLGHEHFELRSTS